MRIRKRLSLLFLLISIIPIILVGLFAYRNARQSLLTSYRHELEAVLGLKRAVIEHFFEDVKADVRMIDSLCTRAFSPELFEGLKGNGKEGYPEAITHLDEHLRPWLKRHEGVLGFTFLDRDENILYHLSSNFRPEFSPGNHFPYPLTGSRDIGAEVFLSDIFKTSKHLFSTFAFMLIFDQNNRLLGKVVFEFNMDMVNYLLLETTGLGKTGETFLVKKVAGKGQGKDHVLFLGYLRHTGNDHQLKIDIGDPRARSSQDAAKGGEGWGIVEDYRGKRVLAAWKYLPLLDFGLVAKIDMEELEQPVTQLGILILFICVVIILVVVLTSLIVSRSISGPINRLSKGTQIVGAGDLDYKVGIDTPDEIGQLSRDFDRMIENLRKITASRDELNVEIEARMIIEEALKERTAELERSNKELESFSYSVSHDLRAPLRHMDGFSKMLQEDYGQVLDARAKEYLERICQSSRKMSRLIEDLLQLSHISRQELKKETVDLSGIVKMVFSELRNEDTQKKVDCQAQEGITALCDSGLLTICLQNLIGNAWKFTSRQPEAKIEFGMTVPLQGKMAYYVRDNGVGFDMAYAEKLFAPFQRLCSEQDFPGTGIGLALVQRIIHRHGGKIWAESRAGQGATFYFTL